MFKLMFSLFLLLPLTVSAESDQFYIGGGQVNYFKGNTEDHAISSIIGWESIEKYPLVITLSHVPTYDRTNSVWKGKRYYRYARSHNVATIGKQLNHKFNNGITLYGEFGFAYVDRKSIALDAHFNFYESIGLRYKNVRLFIRHTSNAGIEGQNLGEDILYLTWNF